MRSKKTLKPASLTVVFTSYTLRAAAHNALRWLWCTCDNRLRDRDGNPHIELGKTKNGEPVLAPLGDAAVGCLKQVPVLNNNPYILCGIKHGAYLVGLRRTWYCVRTAARLDDLRLHDLSRTVGSWLVQHGESLHLVGQVLNHRDPKTEAGVLMPQPVLPPPPPGMR